MFWNSKVLGVAVSLLIASGALALLAVEFDSGVLAILAMVGMGIAAIAFLASFWKPRRVDWNRIRAEQRLWESGPLGRRWLKIRQRLEDKLQ